MGRSKNVVSIRRFGSLWLLSMVAVLFACLTGILANINARVENIIQTRLQEFDVEFSEWAQRQVEAAVIRAIEHDTTGSPRGFTSSRWKAKLSSIKTSMRKLNRYVHKFFIVQLNFVGPTDRAYKKFRRDAKKLDQVRSDQLPTEVTTSDPWVSYRIASLGDQYYRKYLKSRNKFAHKLASIQRSTLRFLLASVAMMTISTTLAALLSVSLTSDLIALFQHCCRQRYRRLPTSESVVPAYIIGGQLFVDTSSRSSTQRESHFSGKSFDTDDDLENDDTHRLVPSHDEEKKSIDHAASRAVRNRRGTTSATTDRPPQSAHTNKSNRLLFSSVRKYQRPDATHRFQDDDENDPEAPGTLLELPSTSQTALSAATNAKLA